MPALESDSSGHARGGDAKHATPPQAPTIDIRITEPISEQNDNNIVPTDMFDLFHEKPKDQSRAPSPLLKYDLVIEQGQQPHQQQTQATDNNNDSPLPTNKCAANNGGTQQPPMSMPMPMPMPVETEKSMSGNSSGNSNAGGVDLSSLISEFDPVFLQTPPQPPPAQPTITTTTSQVASSITTTTTATTTTTTTTASDSSNTRSSLTLSLNSSNNNNNDSSTSGPKTFTISRMSAYSTTMARPRPSAANSRSTSPQPPAQTQSNSQLNTPASSAPSTPIVPRTQRRSRQQAHKNTPTIRNYSSSAHPTSSSSSSDEDESNNKNHTGSGIDYDDPQKIQIQISAASSVPSGGATSGSASVGVPLLPRPPKTLQEIEELRQRRSSNASAGGGETVSISRYGSACRLDADESSGDDDSDQFATKSKKTPTTTQVQKEGEGDAGGVVETASTAGRKASIESQFDLELPDADDSAPLDDFNDKCELRRYADGYYGCIVLVRQPFRTTSSLVYKSALQKFTEVRAWTECLVKLVDSTSTTASGKKLVFYNLHELVSLATTADTTLDKIIDIAVGHTCAGATSAAAPEAKADEEGGGGGGDDDAAPGSGSKINIKKVMPFHEIELKASYKFSDLELQQYDTFTKLHTFKLQVSVA